MQVTFKSVVMKQVYIFISEDSPSNAEKRIFENIFNTLSKNFNFNLIKNRTEIDKIEKGSITIGFSTDNMFNEFCSKNNNENINILAFCDLEYPEKIIERDFFYSGYIVPTKYLKKIAKMFVTKEVFILDELVDPIYWSNKADSKNDRYEKMDFCWFGYDQSYNKSMCIYENTIKEALKSGLVRKFSVISSNNIYKSEEFEYINYSDRCIKNYLENFGYCILSHMPLDLHLNTLNKSPNKLISAISCGVFPVCSNTPSYAELMNYLGLGEYLFNNKNDLKNIIFRLKNEREKNFSKVLYAQEKLQALILDKKEENIEVMKRILNMSIDKVSIDLDKHYIGKIMEAPTFFQSIENIKYKIIKKILNLKII